MIRDIEYVQKALSLSNRKPYDGDSNCPYRVDISFAEVGAHLIDPASFWTEIKIPRQVDNSLGMARRQTINDRKEAAAILRKLADELDKEPT